MKITLQFYSNETTESSKVINTVPSEKKQSCTGLNSSTIPTLGFNYVHYSALTQVQGKERGNLSNELLAVDVAVFRGSSSGLHSLQALRSPTTLSPPHSTGSTQHRNYSQWSSSSTASSILYSTGQASRIRQHYFSKPQNQVVDIILNKFIYCEWF